MKRLTYQWNCGYAIDLPNALSGKSETLEWSISERERGLRLTGDIPARLAAYEDIGLEPEEIKDLELEDATLKTIEKMYDGLGSPDHLLELVQAEKDGHKRIAEIVLGSCWYDADGQLAFGAGEQDDGEWLDLTIELSALNKVVFLTREEAEAALKGGDKE